MHGNTGPACVDQYDSRTYTRKGLATRVVIREKPFVKSRSQRLADFLRPSVRMGFNVVQGFELGKVMACIVFPVFMLLYWKRVQKRLPDHWESQFAGLQHRQLKEETAPEHPTDYFTIIDTFEERRERALQRKRMDVQSADPNADKSGRNGPKRARSESVDGSSSNTTTPATQPASAATTPPNDPVLEEQMERLGVDDEFKASLRSMSPNTRTDVLNDIVRNQNAERIQRMVTSFRLVPHLGGGRLFAPAAEDLDTLQTAGDDESEDMPESFTPPHRRIIADTSVDLHEHFMREVTSFHERLLRAQILQGTENTGFINVFGEIIAQRSMGITQDIDDMSYEQLLELQERIGYVSKGITREQMRQCINDTPRPKDGSCVVCQSEWQEMEGGSEKAVELKTCQHVFHRGCIEQWLTANKTCPVCKQEVI